MANLIFAIGIIGNVISLLVFASPIKTFCGVVKKKSTENYKIAPYITTFLCTSLWTSYGILKPNNGFLIATVNGAGAIFHCIYIIMFLIYSPQDQKVRMAQMVAILDVGFVGTAISVTLFALHGAMQLTFLGILCSVLTILMYASPLLAMKTVMKTKSVESMPFLVSFFMVLNAGVWAFYSLLVKDFFIGIPNLIGLILGSAQLTVYVIYKKPESTMEPTMAKGDIVNMMEMGEYKCEEEAEGKVFQNQKIKTKTLSFEPNNLPSTTKHDDDDVDIQIGVKS